MRQPGISPPEACLARTPTVLADLRLKVVTPMFGGGATPGKSDDDWPIRPSAIGGHLRFWWRACNARRFETLEEMYEEESLIWGAATDKNHPQYGPGAIAIDVSIVDRGTNSFHFHDSKEIAFKYRGWHHGEANDTVPVYPRGPSLAMFPFTGAVETPTSPAKPPEVGREGVKFTLRLSLHPRITDPNRIDTCLKASEQALWGWITFGGVGARTRRGCGTVQCIADVGNGTFPLPAETFQPQGNDLGDWFNRRFGTLVHRGTKLPLVPSLGGPKTWATIKLGESDHIATSAWFEAVDPMRVFRQGRNVGRNQGGGTNHPGQSRWPEPGAIREMLDIAVGGKCSDEHKYSRTTEADGRDFPRADLGLPINFELMPGKPRLEGTNPKAQRMASPIILKALPLANGEYLPLALRLDAPHPWDSGTPDFRLKRGNKEIPLRLSPMNNPAPHWPKFNPPPTPIRRPPYTTTNASARDAFMDYLELDLQWKKVMP